MIARGLTGGCRIGVVSNDRAVRCRARPAPARARRDPRRRRARAGGRLRVQVALLLRRWLGRRRAVHRWLLHRRCALLERPRCRRGCGALPGHPVGVSGSDRCADLARRCRQPGAGRSRCDGAGVPDHGDAGQRAAGAGDPRVAAPHGRAGPQAVVVGAGARDRALRRAQLGSAGDVLRGAVDRAAPAGSCVGLRCGARARHGRKAVPRTADAVVDAHAPAPPRARTADADRRRGGGGVAGGQPAGGTRGARAVGGVLHVLPGAHRHVRGDLDVAQRLRRSDHGRGTAQPVGSGDLRPRCAGDRGSRLARPSRPRVGADHAGAGLVPADQQGLVTAVRSVAGAPAGADVTAGVAARRVRGHRHAGLLDRVLVARAPCPVHAVRDVRDAGRRICAARGRPHRDHHPGGA